MTSTPQEELLQQISTKLNAVIAVLLRVQRDGQRQGATKEAVFLWHLGLPWQHVAEIQDRSLDEVMKGVLQKTLSTAKAYKAYVACDGKRDQHKIATQAGVTQPTVSTMCTKWHALGLVSNPSEGKAKALFDPEPLGVLQPD